MEKKYWITFYPLGYNMIEWRNCTEVGGMQGGALRFVDSDNKRIHICGHWIVREEKS